MSNNVRACFCLPKPLNKTQLDNLLKRIHVLGCDPVGEPNFNQGYWVEQKLAWSMPGEFCNASFIQLYSSINLRSMFSFDIDADIFLPGRKLSYFPDRDPGFNLYKDLLTQIVIQTNPQIGQIDYEADLICTEMGISYAYNLASWGNYFPLLWLNNLSAEMRERLFKTVDETNQVEGMGLITFIHPLKANQAWSARHEELENIIRENFNY